MLSLRLSFLSIFLVAAYHAYQIQLELTNSEDFHTLPRFWTSTGFCPMGAIHNSPISNYLLSDDVETNLHFLATLPNNAISKVRIHWLLELIRFIGVRSGRVPVYDFTNLDNFLDKMVRLNLSVGFELMGNPNNMFHARNASQKAFWEDLMFSIGRRYKFRYGVKTLQKWEFETWNEPDLKTYNLLNFTIPDYIDYIKMARRGLDALRRASNNTHFSLSGPAGLFKDPNHHPLCWAALQYCNNSESCPFDRITFHRKGNGQGAREIVWGGLKLAKAIHEKYPKLKNVSISNNEADPIAGWSTGRPFQSDTRYAAILTDTVLQHWSAKLNTEAFRSLNSISHDNAFLSFHPFEFDQRTLLARFQMNFTKPPHSQFIQKPVYAILGLLGNLAELATDIRTIELLNTTLLVTKSGPKSPMYSAIIIISHNEQGRTHFDLNISLPNVSNDDTIASIVEAVESDLTDPVKIWKFCGSPAYPNSTVRFLMRMSQIPIIIESKITKINNQMDQEWKASVNHKLSLRTPAVALLRICSLKVALPPKPEILKIQPVNPSEVLIFWKEAYQKERCIRTYEVFFRKQNEKNWKLIVNAHVPFLSFHFAPDDKIVEGYYKVRGVDLFYRNGPESDVVSFRVERF